MIMFLFARTGVHRDLHRVYRRQRQMCIRDRHIDLNIMIRKLEEENSRLREELETTGLKSLQRELTVDEESQAEKKVLEFLSAPEDEDLSLKTCLLYTSPSPRDLSTSRMPSSA
eukprot:TRINITY_DN19643_c0_g1_i2.p1 TRINITY_DN19643_c0_g1~~TRINITY_DN19643_c0_g1_i2.p1  ORF type:complete len:114 (-),score=28.70 TRINITY_DN19643_c0_g1_i2:25-366(-)